MSALRPKKKLFDIEDVRQELEKMRMTINVAKGIGIKSFGRNWD